MLRPKKKKKLTVVVHAVMMVAREKKKEKKGESDACYAAVNRIDGRRVERWKRSA